MLSDSDDDVRDHQLAINEHYAKAFQYRKEREELEKLKAKLGSDISESDIEEMDSESAESEDEEGEELTPAVDAAILRTLVRIRRKDPSIYESGKDVFGEEQERIPSENDFIGPRKNQGKEKDLSKPITLRQIALEAQLNSSRSPSPEPLTHVQEQRALRREAITAFHTAISDGDSDDEDDEELLVLREKTKDEQEKEEQEYRAFLEREVGDLKEVIGTLDVGGGDEEAHHADEVDPKIQSKKKKTKERKQDTGSTAKKQKSKEEENQEFLMNYILGRGWIDKSKNRVPTYKEVTSKHKSGKRKRKSTPDSDSDPKTDTQQPTTSNAHTNINEEDPDALSDSSFDSLADAFENSYNFRFEEPDGALIPSFPRNISSLVRREDNKRKDARERRNKRKEEEVQRMKEEVRRMKALKMREIRRKLELIGKEGGILGAERRGKGEDVVTWDSEPDGVVDAALQGLDLEGDWDPEKHDKQIAGLFTGEGDWEDLGEVDQDGKPFWEDDIDIGDVPIPKDDDISMTSNRKKDKKKKKKKKGREEEQEEEGVDLDAMDADVQDQRKEMDVGEEKEWDGTEEMRKKKLDEYMEEIYQLDFNDMVGDMPTRFKYASVAPQSYSLTPVEILMATDKELNEYMSVKKYAPYRNDARKWDAKRQHGLKELRATIAGRAEAGGWQLSGGIQDTVMGQGEARGGERGKKRKGKKERLKSKAAAATEAQAEGQDEEVLVSNGGNADANLNREKGQGYKRKSGEIAEVGVEAQQDETPKRRKKRRRKHKHGVEGSLVKVEQ